MKKLCKPLQSNYRSKYPLVLRQRLGTQVHQRRYAEVQRQPHHP
jgi:hypothetical protein